MTSPAGHPSSEAQAAETGPAHAALSSYSRRVLEHSARASALGARSRLFSNLRGLCFGVFVACAIAALVSSRGLLWGSVAGGVFLVFMVLVFVHARVIEAEQLALRWVQVNKDALTRNGSRFRELPEDGARFSNPLHPYADDLDLFGRASLFQRLCTARTHFGQHRLAAYLMNRAPTAEVLERQAAVRELAPQLDLRQELEALALAVVDPLPPPGVTSADAQGSQNGAPAAGGGSAPTAPTAPTLPAAPATKSQALDAEPLLAWAERGPQLSKQRSVVLVAWVLPAITLSVLVLASLFDWHPLSWLLLLIAQAVFLLTARTHTSAVFAAVSLNQGLFLRFGPMLKLLERMQPTCERLLELQREVQSAEGEPPSQAMRQFERIVSWFELRHNGLVYPFINALFMWDVQCVLRLERWQQKNGKRLRRWFTALGELEALSSLAAFAHDNPDYSWPELDSERTHFVARGVGHPLLSAAQRVVNDVELAGPGQALLVTGSNMSGKSTLLRAMGVNAVLALAGAPVCATRLSLSPLSVRTSMRIKDSLDQGVSHFYAELRKIKGVLDSLNAPAPVFFLLDEVLHGTNSRERQIGARWVLAELLRNGALGALSTHDSGLCELPPHLMDKVTQVHLRELARDGELTFDYKLHPGPVRSGNALRLMRSLGIAVPHDEAQDLQR